MRLDKEQSNVTACARHNMDTTSPRASLYLPRILQKDLSRPTRGSSRLCLVTIGTSQLNADAEINEMSLVCSQESQALTTSFYE